MRVEDMAVVTVEIAVAMEDTVADMPRPATLGADMVAMSKLDTLFAAKVATIMRAVRAETRAMQGAHIIGIAAVIGEAAAIGKVITDIPGSAITARAMAIRITDMAITVTATVGTMVRTITDITLTATDIGHP
jgi:hypothetical protein